MSEAASDTKWPCPDCIGTFIPGEQVTLPRSQGRGKIAYNPSWNWPSGSFQPGVQYPPDEYRECRRCDGTGLVADRRTGQADRRRRGLTAAEVIEQTSPREYRGRK